MRVYKMSFSDIDNMPLSILLDFIIVNFKLNGNYEPRAFIDDVF